jgi:hypothetical protein
LKEKLEEKISKTEELEKEIEQIKNDVIVKLAEKDQALELAIADSQVKKIYNTIISKST